MDAKVQVLEPISDETKERVFKHYGTNQTQAENDVRTIIEWAQKQPHFPETPSEAITMRFLLLSKCNIEKAKSKLDNYYTIRTKIPEVFAISNPNTPEMMNYADINYYLFLPKTTDDLHRVSIFKLTTDDASKFDPLMYFAWSLDVAEIRLHEDFNVSDIIIVDLVNCGLGHLIKVSPMMMKKAATCIERVYTSRTQGLHFLNCPPMADRFLKALKLVVNPKIADRFFVHNDLNSLYEYVPKKILPTDYGGDEKSLKELNDNLKLKMAEYKQRFDTLGTLKVNESLRPENCSFSEEGFGVYGSFRQIEFD